MPGNDACYDGEVAFLDGLVFGRRGSLTQNRRKSAIFFFGKILVVYLGHIYESCHPVAVLSFSQTEFGSSLGLKLPNWRTSKRKKKGCTFIVARVSKSECPSWIFDCKPLTLTMLEHVSSLGHGLGHRVSDCIFGFLNIRYCMGMG